MVFVFVALSFLILFWCIFWQICDSKHSDLIPCLDRDLHHQLKLRLNLTLMEHYEHHCPPPERRFNCLVPPPAGYKVGLVSLSCLSILAYVMGLMALVLSGCFVYGVVFRYL